MSGAAVVDSSRTRRRLTVGEADYEVFRLAGVEGPDRLPFSLKVLLENLLRNEDGRRVTADDICALAAWDPGADPTRRSGSPRTAAVAVAAVCMRAIASSMSSSARRAPAAISASTSRSAEPALWYPPTGGSTADRAPSQGSSRAS